MNAIIVIFISLMISSSHQFKIDQHMNDDEILKVFKVARDKVSNFSYEVVPFHHDFYFEHNATRSRRAVPNVKLKAFSKDYNLYLEKSGHVLFGENTPVFMAKTKRGKARQNAAEPETGIQYTKTKFTLPKNFEALHSRKPRAALTVYEDNKDRLHFEGVVDDHLIVRPIPERIHDKILVKFLNESSLKEETSGNYFSYEIGNDSSAEVLPMPTHHIVIKIKPMDWEEDDELGHDYSSSGYNVADAEKLNEGLESSMKDYNETKVEAWQIVNGGKSMKKQQPKNLRNSTNPQRHQSNRVSFKKPVTLPKSKPASQVSPTAYLELLVVVDHETLRIHGQNVKDLFKYLAGFWNAVDLRFREFHNPSIRLNIAGIIIPEEAGAAYYLEEFPVGPDTIEVENTLIKFGNYFATKFSRSMCNYDAVVGVMARRFGMYSRDGGFTTGIGGLAHIGQACLLDAGHNGILVRDLGVFDGIIPAAHEVGHAIGAYHDGEEPSEGRGEVCNWNDGFIMSYEVKNKNHFHWSKCSKTQINTFLRSEGAACLKNRPKVGKALGKTLPGKWINRDDQCKVLGGSYYQAKKDSTSCILLECVLILDPNVAVEFTFSPPEGVSCGKKKICLDGECVAEPPNL